MNAEFFEKLTPLYTTYNEVIKPLVAEIEARFESFPTSLFNEIRAFNDHVSRCYQKPNDGARIDEQVRKAKGHIERIVLDCYKYLNVSLYDLIIKDFDKTYKRVDLSAINNGEFLIKHRELTREITLKLKEAKLKETQDDKSESISIYQDVHNKYTELEELIDTNCRSLFWARGKFYRNMCVNFLGWLLAAIISGIISSSFIPYDKFIELVVSLF
jgi:hypothetical protein